MTSVGPVVRVEEEAVDEGEEELPEEPAGDAFWELVQPARMTAEQTRTISTRTVLVFIPDDDRRNYLLVAIPVPELSFKEIFPGKRGLSADLFECVLSGLNGAAVGMTYQVH